MKKNIIHRLLAHFEALSNTQVLCEKTNYDHDDYQWDYVILVFDETRCRACTNI